MPPQRTGHPYLERLHTAPELMGRIRSGVGGQPPTPVLRTAGVLRPLVSD